MTVPSVVRKIETCSTDTARPFDDRLEYFSMYLLDVSTALCPGLWGELAGYALCWGRHSTLAGSWFCSWCCHWDLVLERRDLSRLPVVRISPRGGDGKRGSHTISIMYQLKERQDNCIASQHPFMKPCSN